MEFCPACGVLLQIAPASGRHHLRLFCSTCPYVCAIQNKIVKKSKLVKKEVEPIVSLADAMESGAKTAAACPRCHHGEAYYRQAQIRSADEPMTIIYTCCKKGCHFQWKED